MRGWSFAKGHGTENDFVLVVDRENMQPVSPEQVEQICDRRAGIGADGLLRAVLAKHIDGLGRRRRRSGSWTTATATGRSPRCAATASGSSPATWSTRAWPTDRSCRSRPGPGLREAELLPDGRIRVAMGPVVVAPEPVRIVTADDTAYDAVAVDVGNPHAVSFTDELGAGGSVGGSRTTRTMRSRRGSTPSSCRCSGTGTWPCGSTSGARARRAPAAPARWRPPQPHTPARRSGATAERRAGPVPRRRARWERRGGTRRAGVLDRAGGGRRPRCDDDPGMTDVP